MEEKYATHFGLGKYMCVLDKQIFIFRLQTNNYHRWNNNKNKSSIKIELNMNILYRTKSNCRVTLATHIESWRAIEQ